MIISFDIDNLLIPYGDEFEVEQIPFWYKILGAEALRKGIKPLFRTLEKEGHQIWIYTTSYRSLFALSLTFRSQGLYPSKFINESLNRKTLRAQRCTASKNPKLFGIDLHIDDAKGVEIEGIKFGFQTLIISPQDKKWTEKILAQLKN